MDFERELNERQYEAVSTASQYVRIVAGAGSGKTRVLTYRIAYLISEMRINPRSILAITFTNKVAKEMKERALRLVPEAGNSLSISTFHSFCARFIRMECSAIGFPTNFTIYDDEDQEKLLKDIAVDFGYKKKDEIVKQSMDFIYRQKCLGNYPDQVVLKDFEYAYGKEYLRFFEEYENRKNSMYALDFDDLLIRTIQILENFPEIREKWQYRISHILIDEFQDTNDVQFKLLKLLAKPSTCIYVVGDPDQTIYTWRGANQEIILNFEKTFPHPETIILDRNYRSTQVILDTANKLIAHNKKRIPKDLYTQNLKGDPIVAHQATSRDDEAFWFAKTLEELKKSTPNFSYGDVAVLYRSSSVTLPFEKELTRRQISYRVFGGLKFYQRKEIKDVLAYAKLIFQPLDDMSFARIYNIPRRGVGETSFEKLKDEKTAHRMSFYNYIKNIDQFETNLPTKVVTPLVSMVSKLEKYKEKFQENLEVYSNVLEQMIVDLGYMDYLAELDDGDDRIDNVKSLYNDIYNFIKNNPQSDFQEYLQNVSLAAAQDDVIEGDYVSFMTVHTAKGLEFPYVFVVGLNEGVFPNGRANDERGHDGLEEERRLCYVAFTRAMKKLFVSCNSDFSYIANSRLIPSQFFAEAGIKLPNQYQNFYQTRYESKYKNDFDVSQRQTFNEDKPKQEFKPRPFSAQTNGIVWSVGDEVIHKKFGYGVVTKLIDGGNIIEIEFSEFGKKTLLGQHPMISKKEIGGKA